MDNAERMQQKREADTRELLEIAEGLPWYSWWVFITGGRLLLLRQRVRHTARKVRAFLS
jgi:hypothetical protein